MLDEPARMRLATMTGEDDGGMVARWTPTENVSTYIGCGKRQKGTRNLQPHIFPFRLYNDGYVRR